MNTFSLMAETDMNGVIELQHGLPQEKAQQELEAARENEAAFLAENPGEIPSRLWLVEE